MSDLDVAVSVLAVVAFPLVGIGPMLLRLLRPAGYTVWMLLCSATVYLLTGELWATAFTACLAGAVVVPRRTAADPAAVAGGYANDRGSALR
ncbi:hypothetical protein [Piscinibacter sp. XHJ-5]|uniref:hypothetical protein n=1 Tax=Piscinibacter sp. XHJ-5 TaxID=3037797 RepID=UPI0024528C5C|nr:hypothetical protein [Piscinibacter sp. XHJ-5]